VMAAAALRIEALGGTQDRQKGVFCPTPQWGIFQSSTGKMHAGVPRMDKIQMATCA
jgi:hypothetical protein